MNNSSAASLPTPDDRLDLRGTPCPLNFVRTKLRLQKLPPGQLLEVWLDPGDPIEQVPDSLHAAGYPVAAIVNCGNYFALQVRQSTAV
ncbi:putative redox protein, regulator of disulfide bond formation [Rubidibacter lacunae KORDI 51-2]|uniref:Putative redox protein, regulator of disulfide bond formation n=1 Tax=Rubidibacter lacunae KORDI 51-2 TaxID=582515 RepID=U5DJI1_9CHRO|nr:sulfurtransferase TusA family protein [Rubidibacter lacunae]ERN40734.1 putative redox protein, regulator of disulfide bond formation [Rubidibacter lacunae KORDI 51-2]